ncbi:uncharacterized protein L201_005790 [Kwoniella dendrophila CBS 6074]|uniref:Uncharacterized protein n=1 Tax=Kwoniella dendrophila CBS 6074 TaxID=1295534 RepID=A0AAX4K279_9TREE
MSHRPYGEDIDYDNNGNFEDVELGNSPKRSKSRFRNMTGEGSKSPNRSTDYFNYHPPLLILLLAFTVWLFLLLICFTSPQNGGLSVVFQDGTDYIGVLIKCTASSCDPWMSSDGSSSSTSSSSSSSSTSETSSSSSSSSSTTTSSSRNNVNVKRGEATSSDLSNFFLTTGLATLASFWLMSYSLLFIIMRYISSKLPLSGEDEEVELNTEKWSKSESTRKYLKSHWKSFKNPIKKFAFKTSRIFLFFLSWTLLGVSLDATVKSVKVTGGNGFGIGLILLHICWVILLFITYIEISRGTIRRKLDLTFWGFKCLQVCPSYNRRSKRKWEDYDSLRGKSSSSSSNDEIDEKERGRFKSRNRIMRSKSRAKRERQERFDREIYV